MAMQATAAVPTTGERPTATQIWARAQANPDDQERWRLSRTGQRDIARLETLDMDFFMLELHEEYMQIAGILVLTEDVPAPSRERHWWAPSGGPWWDQRYCASCADGRKANCDEKQCPKYDPAAVWENKVLS